LDVYGPEDNTIQGEQKGMTKEILNDAKSVNKTVELLASQLC
jgi:hypothetical protein